MYEIQSCEVIQPKLQHHRHIWDEVNLLEYVFSLLLGYNKMFWWKSMIFGINSNTWVESSEHKYSPRIHTTMACYGAIQELDLLVSFNEM